MRITEEAQHCAYNRGGPTLCVYQRRPYIVRITEEALQCAYNRGGPTLCVYQRRSYIVTMHCRLCTKVVVYQESIFIEIVFPLMWSIY